MILHNAMVRSCDANIPSLSVLINFGVIVMVIGGTLKLFGQYTAHFRQVGNVLNLVPREVLVH